MGLVEPPMAATLELQRLRAFDQVGARPPPAHIPTAFHTAARPEAGPTVTPHIHTHTLPPCASPPQVSYTSSRNRQWHIYTLMERKNRHSLPLKRVFLR